LQETLFIIVEKGMYIGMIYRKIIDKAIDYAKNPPFLHLCVL